MVMMMTTMAMAMASGEDDITAPVPSSDQWGGSFLMCQTQRLETLPSVYILDSNDSAIYLPAYITRHQLVSSYAASDS